MESIPLRAIPLLSISSPCRGILFYKYKERARGRLVLGIEDLKKAVLWLGLCCIHALKLLILVYVLCKNKKYLNSYNYWILLDS